MVYGENIAPLEIIEGHAMLQVETLRKIELP